jgi:hypothetical protein
LKGKPSPACVAEIGAPLVGSARRILAQRLEVIHLVAGLGQGYMKGADEFLTIVTDRETGLMKEWFSHPEARLPDS